MVRTRIAPSPTGQMHIGNFRTALYSYFWAKKNNGKFILRIEDTDRKRLVPGVSRELLDLFKAFDIEVDEFPNDEQLSKVEEIVYPKQDWLLDDEYLKSVKDSDFDGVYVQSQRLPIYLKYARELYESGNAYACFLTEQELEDLKSNSAKNVAFRSPHRHLPQEEVIARIKSGNKYVIRLNIENYIKNKGTSIVEYEDLVLGKMEFDLNTVDDQVLIKSDGVPTYHMAVVVDDHLMNITHPIRAYSWLPSTPKQVVVYDMFGWEMPPFAHVTDILDPAGGKLSKRRGAVFAIEFLKEGYLPEAIINFVVLVGWTPKIERNYGEKEREIFSKQEILESFDLSGISKSNPVFNHEKLQWFNKEYIAKSDNSNLRNNIVNWLERYAEDKSLLPSIKNDEQLESKLELTKTRAATLVDLSQSLKFFYGRPENINWDIKQLDKVKDKVGQIKSDIKDFMSSLSEDHTEWTHEGWEAGMRAIGDKHEVKHGDVFMVLRVAVVGEPFSPPLYESLQILGKEEILARLS